MPFRLPAPHHGTTAAPVVTRVLLVDDEETICTALRRFFVRRGWEVAEATDGEAARRMLDPEAHQWFDLVIVDLRMPRVSGAELYEWLAVHRPAVIERLVFSSGDVLAPESADFLASAQRPVLPKPFELSELTRIVEQVCGVPHGA